MFARLIVSEEENGAVFECEASSTSLGQPLLEQITLVVEFATSKVEVTGKDIGEVSEQEEGNQQLILATRLVRCSPLSATRAPRILPQACTGWSTAET